MWNRKKLKKWNKNDEDKLKEEIEKDGGLEKGDIPAMTFSALATILPVCVLVLGAFALLILLIFGAL